MHIAISWDISAQGSRWTEINDKLVEQLRDYSWVRPLNTFYVVKTVGEADRIIIKDRLIQAGQSVLEEVKLLVSPSMVGGRYDGLLPPNDWELVNQRTD